MRKLIKVGNYTVWLLPAGSDPVARRRFERLRYKEFALRMGLEPTNSHRIERDAFDAFADYLILTRSETPEIIEMGCRIINGNLCTLPVIPYVSMNRHIPCNSCEVSRIVEWHQQEEKKAKLEKCFLLYATLSHTVFVVREYDALLAHIRVCFLRRLRFFFGDEFLIKIGPEKECQKNGKLLPLIPVRGYVRDAQVIWSSISASLKFNKVL